MTPRPTPPCSPRSRDAPPRRTVEVHELDRHINDPAFAKAMADHLHEMMPGIPRMTPHEILAQLRARSRAAEPIIGGGAGTGLSAKCEEAGGIDLIIIYNSGRYRMAGRGSLAGLMPYGNANEIVKEMAGEVLPVVKHTPVLAGVCGTDPFRLMPQFLAELSAGLRRRAELPDGRPDRRHVPRQPRGDRHGLRLEVDMMRDGTRARTC